MPNKIDNRLALLHSTGRTGIMTHVVVGYPSVDATEAIVRAMAAHGVDLVEMQIPFSDPLADGPTIQAACSTALAAGTRVSHAFEVAERLKDLDIPLLFMCYYNTVFKYGVDRFCQDAAAAGISGLIVPDVPLEAARHEGYLDRCATAGLYNIITVSPESTQERLAKNAAIAQGFVYCMARQGVTGAGGTIHNDLAAYIKTVRDFLQVPIALGFGISNRERFETVAPHCDVAVVGSAIIDVVARSSEADVITNVEEFLDRLQGVRS
jgi:tryptophan synthase alpha chain